MFAETNRVDAVALDTYDNMLIQHGTSVFERRALFIDQYTPLFQRYYSFIVEDEVTAILYNTELKDMSFAEGLRQSRSKDLFLQRTTFEIPRDDSKFKLGQGALKRLGYRKEGG